MKLNYDRKSKDPTYFVQHGFRNGKKTSTRNIFKIGKHSELLAQGHSDPLEYARCVVAEYNEKYKNANFENMEITINFNEKLKPTDNVYSKSTSLNIGYLYLQAIYNKLNLKDFFDKISKDRKVTFDLNDVNKFLTYARMLDPKSKYGTCDDFENYFGNVDIKYQHIERFLPILAKNFDAYIEHLYNNSENVIKRDTSVCYYDCTNYYFEIETDDEDYIDEVTGEHISGFRKYGPSKEHRPNPLVEMGLFMDKNGIPITMELFPGNTNEQTTVNPLEGKLIRMLNNKKIIYCGDAGLGSASIRLLNDMGGRAFIVTQSIKKLSEELQNTVFEDSGYKLLSDNSTASIKHMKSFDKLDEKNLDLYNDKIYKVIDVDSDVDLGLLEEKTLKNGKTKLVKSKNQLKQRVIITFSRKMMEYQRKIREKQIERAKYLLKTNQVENKKKGPNDVTRFIKSEDKTNYSLDLDRISLEEKYDGFYAIATNLTDENIKEIIKVSEQRYRIEDCFRILKTNFQARPVYHHNEDTIKAHFMVCYTSLLIYRLLENLLKKKKYNFTINNIISTIKNMKVVNCFDLYYQAAYTSSKLLSALEDLFDLGLDEKYYLPKRLNALAKKN